MCCLDRELCHGQLGFRGSELVFSNAEASEGAFLLHDFFGLVPSSLAVCSRGNHKYFAKCASLS